MHTFLTRKKIFKNTRFIMTGQAEVEAVLSSLTLDNPTLKTMMHLMNREMDKGLDPATQEESDIKMFSTYVRSLPDGAEEGETI
jgi:hexokinase